MNTRNNVAFSSTELVYIGGIGFMFEVSQTIKHNLISPDVLSFFDGVKESGDVIEECAFPASIPNTNLSHSIFHNIEEEWIVCHDGVFRKCAIVECEVKANSDKFIISFFVDISFKNSHIVGLLSKDFFMSNN